MKCRRIWGGMALAAAALALAATLSGCAAPDSGMMTSTHGRYAWALQMDNSNLDKALRVTAYKAGRKGKRINASVTVVSHYSTTLVLEARFVWVDADGAFLEGAGFVPWRTVTLKPGVPKTLKAKSSDSAAANVRLQVRGGAKSWII